jgi:aspartate carbamoyltransferase catalytic subunit
MPTFVRSLGVDVSTDLADTLQWADAVNMLRIQLERQDTRFFPSLREYTRLFGLTNARLEACQRPLTILHPGPINRGVEISTDVADGPGSIILDQVENGVAIRMAVLYLLAQESY